MDWFIPLSNLFIAAVIMVGIYWMIYRAGYIAGMDDWKKDHDA